MIEKNPGLAHYHDMEITTDLGRTNPVKGSVIALGSFDGVHLGHRAMLAQARAMADQLKAPLAVLTFEPHPRQVLRPQTPPFRLTTAARKAELLAQCGVDILYQVPFTPDLASCEPCEFEREILLRQLGVRGLITGGNFLYGRDRGGNFSTLSAFCSANGIAIEQADTARDGQGEPYSSTRVRQALADARPDHAAELLGRHHDVTFTVETGDQRGRALGFATANGRFGELVVPTYGIYAVRAWLRGCRDALPGVANLGIRPMWRLEEPIIEAHLFDFDREIYGETLRVALLAYLRPEQKFTGTAALVDQIARDCDNARTICARTALLESPGRSV
jgi:riboflavin kinase/FMN adenylyltransferase